MGSDCVERGGNSVMVCSYISVTDVGDLIKTNGIMNTCLPRAQTSTLLKHCGILLAQNRKGNKHPKKSFEWSLENYSWRLLKYFSQYFTYDWKPMFWSLSRYSGFLWHSKGKLIRLIDDCKLAAGGNMSMSDCFRLRSPCHREMTRPGCPPTAGRG